MVSEVVVVVEDLEEEVVVVDLEVEVDDVTIRKTFVLFYTHCSHTNCNI